MVVIFSLEKAIIMHLLLKMKKTHFLNEISSKKFLKFSSQNGLKINSCKSISYTIKIHSRIHSQP
jgi:hypothetical protein